MDELTDLEQLKGIDWMSLAQQAGTHTVEFGGRVLVAVAIFIIGRIVAKMITNAIRKLMQAQDVDKILESFVSNLVYWVLMVFVVIAAIDRLGVQTTSLIAVMGAAGLAVGLALQGSLANFASGVLIVIFRPYKVGDFVEAAGISGTVLQVQILTTIFKTGDNKKIIVPNGQIMSSIITNYSANETRRVDMVVGVSYDDDLDKVRETIQRLIDADERILKDPACTITVSELADSSVNFNVRPWVNTADYWNVKFDFTEAVKKEFDKVGISFPFPQQDVHLYQQSS